MEKLIELITSNTLYLTIAIIIGVMIAISLVKKMIKMIILSFIVLVIYVGYLSYTGQKIPKTREETVKHVKENTSAKVISFTGFNYDNPLNELSDYGLWVSSNSYFHIESAHAYYLHLLVELFMDKTYTSRWKVEYCIDAMLEHAVMHPIRHEFQLSNLLKKD